MTGASARSDRQEALRDLGGGLSRRWLWGALGWTDVRQRYAGSLLGSFWITASIALMATCLTFIFASPLGTPPGYYAAYVTIGLVLWYFIQTSLIEAATVFVGAAETIRNSAMPLSVHVLRLVWRNIIVLGHNVVAVPAVLIAFQLAPSAAVWSVAPGLLLLVINLLCAAALLGLLGARFRDVPPLVTNATQLLFFLTPVFWLPSTVGIHRGWFVAGNPVFAFIDVVRAPLIGDAVAATSWPIVLGVTVVNVALSGLVFAAVRDRVAYWI
jgi:ABC-type polysaccharide/polyol phosphate export permease